jgi:hypothetical protein
LMLWLIKMVREIIMYKSCDRGYAEVESLPTIFNHKLLTIFSSAAYDPSAAAGLKPLTLCCRG